MKSRLVSIFSIGLLAIGIGCGRDLIPTSDATQPPIAVTMLNEQFQGFIGAGPALLAAPSLVDLLGLVHGMGYRPNLDECAAHTQFRAQCWLDIKDPGDALMVATVVDEPCMSAQSVTAALSGITDLVVTVVNPGGCRNGGGSAGLPYLSLLAIPLNTLPADEVTVTVVHTGVTVPPAKVMVDLRRPLNIGTDVRARVNEVDAAKTKASNDATNRLAPGHALSFLAIGTNRWTDTSLGCPVLGHSYSAADARGYIILLKDSDPLQLPMEYHVSGANWAFCGRVAY